MKLLFKQRLFSWFDSYDIYDENGQTVYTVQGQLAWGHCLKIYDARGVEIGTVKQQILTFLPKFELYLGDRYIGCISKEFTFFFPKYHIDCILNSSGKPIANITKELFNWTDTYVIDVHDPQDALCALMLVLAIDAEKCSRKD